MSIQFYLVGSLDYEGKTYAFFQPAEEVDGVAPEEIIVFEVDEENEEVVEELDVIDTSENNVEETEQQEEIC